MALETEKVAEIIDPTFKSGTSDKGKAWTLRKIRTESGKEATTFDDVKVGDDVVLEFNAQYKNYSAARPNQKMMFEADVLSFLREINRKLDLLTGEEPDAEEPKKDKPKPVEPPY